MSTRVLHLIASNFVGGPEKQILHHAVDLKGSPYQPLIGSFRDGNATPEILTAAEREGISAFSLVGGIRWKAVKELAALLERERIDLLCSHGYKANILGYLAVRRTGRRQAAFVRGWTAETWRVALYEAIEKRFLGRTARVVCVSRKQAEQLRGARKGRPDPVVVPNAILAPYSWSGPQASLRRPDAGIPGDAFVFGSVGRLSKEKGHEVLLEAFRRVAAADRRRRVFLVLLGDGREQDALRKLAVQLNLERKVMFAGFQRDCAAWMRLLDCLVQPSFTEGTPNSVLEALQMRIPVVATAVGGVPDLIEDRIHGLLVPAGDPGALAAAMSEIADSKQLRDQLTANMLKIGDEYLPQKQRERLIALYEVAMREPLAAR